MVSLLLNFLFCSCILSLISFSLCSLVAHWASLRWLFWIFATQFRDLHSFKVLTGAFLGCYSFIGMFSWFFMILIVWHWCLWIWRKIHLFQALHKSSLSSPWDCLWAEEICHYAILYQFEMRGALGQWNYSSYSVQYVFFFSNFCAPPWCYNLSDGFQSPHEGIFIHRCFLSCCCCCCCFFPSVKRQVLERPILPSCWYSPVTFF